MKSENEETPKLEQHVLQGSHPSEALAAHLNDFEDEWQLGTPYCGTDGTCESCQ